MKHLKTFESFNNDIQNEGVLWDSPKEKFEKEYDNFVKVWSKKGATMPDEAGKKEIFAAAEKDKYQGKMGLSKDGKTFNYRDSKGINWQSEFKGGGTAGAGTGVSK